jgi:hypothetical protein
MKRLLIVAVLACWTWGAAASAQTVEADPVQCWWRTSAGAVRVGEVFSLVLTCSVVDSTAVTVVPDQGPLEPASLQLPPFEVVSGTHLADLRTADHRFFQYDYRLRLINEDLFGKDVAIPEVKLTYRVRSQVNGAALEGAEKTYILPSLAMRVLSLVPAGATDIRDATSSTFADVDSTRFRANVLVASGAVLAALGGILALVTIVRALIRRRGRTVDRALATEADILRGVQTELSRIAAAQQSGGWTPALATRLTTALRIAGAFAVGKPAGLRSAAADNRAQDGLLLLPRGWKRNESVAVSGYLTPREIQDEVQALRSSNTPVPSHRLSMLPLIDELHGVLVRLNAGQYGRQTCSDDTMDEALALAEQLVKRLRRGQIWPVRTFRAASQATIDLRQRVWSR